MLDAAIFSLDLCALALLCAYRLRKSRLTKFARQATLGSHSQHDAVFALGRAIFTGVKRGRDPVFLTSWLAPFGASPTTILERGGCCSGIHRLFITSLDTLGIRSAQVTVYRRADPAAAHCLAQVALGTGNILIDVDYGVWLQHPNGGPIDLAGLRSGAAPAIARFVLDRQAHYADSSRTRSAGYPDRDYYRFDYSVTRTANWAISPLRRALYVLLYRVTKGHVDCLLLPPVLEWPEMLLAVALSAVAVVFVAARAAFTLL